MARRASVTDGMAFARTGRTGAACMVEVPLGVRIDVVRTVRGVQGENGEAVRAG